MKHFLIAALTFLIASCKKESGTIPLPANADANLTGETLRNGTYNATVNCTYAFNENALTNSGWSKIFEDNFEGTAINTTNWYVWTGGAYNNELQHYQAANLIVSNNMLNIVAKKQRVTGATLPWDPTLKTFDFTSGRIESKALYSSNSTSPKVRMSARIRLPSGYGMWPAFWSYGDPWPTQGEIDILEARGQEPTTYYTSYWYGTQNGVNLVTNSTSTINSSISLQSCWHVYELEWAADALRFYLDGQLVDTKTGGYIPSLYGKQEKVTLNLAVGGGFFRSLRVKQIVTDTLHVDWVKVFTSK